MKHTLQLKLSQHLTLTPQLQQSIRLLQLSTIELNPKSSGCCRRIRCSSRRGERRRAAAKSRSQARGASATEIARTRDGLQRRRAREMREHRATTSEAPTSPTTAAAATATGAAATTTTTTSFRSRSRPARCAITCIGQLALLNLPLRDRQIVTALIDALDEDGYLPTPLEEIAELFPAELEIEPEELSIALKYVQSFEPAGVGARDCAECLALQLKALPRTRRSARCAEGRRWPPAAARQPRFHETEAPAAHRRRRRARGARPDPQPESAARARRSPRPKRTTSIPDVVVRKVREQWVASLNEAAMPKLRLNRIYADILTRNRESSNQQLAAQLQEAKWLIRNVQQRFDTILRVAQAIVERQRRFFEHGEVAMRPMVLREIADMLSLHESTISRVTTQKYMLTPRGTFELKYFFGSHVATDTGGAASATAIRALIKQLIAAENTKTPLTDSKIADMLGEQGILVARRTIAKYREALQIPPVNMRKAL